MFDFINEIIKIEFIKNKHLRMLSALILLIYL